MSALGSPFVTVGYSCGNVRRNSEIRETVRPEPGKVSKVWRARLSLIEARKHELIR